MKIRQLIRQWEIIAAQHAVSFAIISGNELNGFTRNTETGELFVANSEPLINLSSM